MAGSHCTHPSVPAYLAAAENSWPPVLLRRTPGLANFVTMACWRPVADAEYFSKTLPALAETDIASAHRTHCSPICAGPAEDAAAYGHCARRRGTFFDIRWQGRIRPEVKIPR